MARRRWGFTKTRLIHPSTISVPLLLSLVFLIFPLSGGYAAAEGEPSGWVNVTPPGVTGSARAVTAFGRDIAWVGFAGAAPEDSVMVKTVNGGSAWYPPHIETSIPIGGVLHLSAVDEQSVWAHYGIYVFRSLNGGMTWEEKFEGSMTAHLDDVPFNLHALNRDTAFMVEWTGGDIFGELVNYTEVKKIGPEGVKTLQVPPHEKYGVPGFMPWGPLDVHPLDESDIWMCGVDRDYSGGDPEGVVGLVYRSGNGGATWELNGIPGTCLLSVCPVDDDTAWVAGFRRRSSPTVRYTGVILKTVDGGHTWKVQKEVEGLAFVDVCAVDGEVAWAAGVLSKDILFDPYLAEERGGIFKTTNGGETWEEQIALEGGYIADVCAVDTACAWAVGKGTSGNPLVLRTEDGGDPRPDLLSLDPGAAPVGHVLTLIGKDFGDQKGTSRVMFGSVQAEECLSWTGEEIRVRVPQDMEGMVKVTVETPAGTSNPLSFRCMGEFRVDSVSPTRAFQHTVALSLELEGNGFLPGCRVRLERGGRVIEAFSCTVESETKVGAALTLFGTEPGAYDVVVVNPGGQEARLPSAFTVEAVCGNGSATALLMLGLAMGLIAVSSPRLRAGRKRGNAV